MKLNPLLILLTLFANILVLPTTILALSQEIINGTYKQPPYIPSH
jgi:hypothetical protein